MRFRSTSRRSGGTTARHIEPLEQRQLLSVVAPSFATPVSYNIGTQPSPSVPNVSQDGVATGDLNGDGKLDVAVVHSIDNTVNVLLNKGGGAFSTAVAYPLQSTNSIWVRVADVNGDGKRDLIVLGSKNNNGLIGVLLGNGNGTFKPVVSYAAGGVARGGVGIADFNGDGKPDLVVAQFAAIDSTHSAVDVLINNGSGTFKPFYTVAVPPAARSVAVGDFNKDGKTDLAVADGLGVNNQLDGTYPAGVTIMLGNGHGSFSKAAQYNALPTPDAGSDGHGGGDVVNPELITAGDLNGDGNLDLVLSLYDHNIDIYLGNGNGTFHSAVGADTGEYPRSVAFVDVNHDGKKDLVVDNIGKQSASEPGSIAVLLGNGNGTVQPAIQFTPFNYPGWMTAGDFNGDGRTDLAITRLFDGHSVNVMLGQPPVTVPAPTVTSITPTHGPTSGGTSVTITGTNFLHVTAVRFGSFNATSFTVKSATTIVATAPAESAATVNVTVTNIAGTSPVASADRYTFTSLATLPAPVIFSPGSTAQPGPTITTLTPTFTWRPVTTPGVDGYQLNLYDLTSKKFASFTINGASKSSFTLLAADALAKGHQFVWNLRVLSGGQSGPPSSYFYFQT